MTPPFHAGELAVQTRAGVTDLAARVGRGIHASIPSRFRPFLAAQSLAVVAAIQPDGTLRTAVVTGPPGFLDVVQDDVLCLHTTLPADFQHLAPGTGVGLLVIDLATRQRVRLNGTLERVSPSGVCLALQEVYGNCPKYIQARRPGGVLTPKSPGTIRAPSEVLTVKQQAMVASVDTFFIATTALGRADISHRGGPAGFVQVRDGRYLRFPDYAGNNMFNTLGNLELHPQVSLLVPDFERGQALHLRGTAHVHWHSQAALDGSSAERTVEITLQEVGEQLHAFAPRWQFLGASPFNPPVEPPL